MHRYWQTLIQPLLRTLQPSELLELGAGRGELSRSLLDFDTSTPPRLLAFDAQPMFDHEQWRRGNEERFSFAAASTLAAIEASDGRADVVFIKGEPNWYTVLNALRLLERQARQRRTRFPVVLVGDTGWPYGRRDAYPDPQRVPDAHRQPHAQKGVRPDSAELVELGGLHPRRHHALVEHSLHNGVASAIDDFLAESALRLKRFDWAAFGGLTLLVAPAVLKEKSALAALLREYDAAPGTARLLASIEADRALTRVAASERSDELQRLRRVHSEQLQRLAAAAEVSRDTARIASEHQVGLESKTQAALQQLGAHAAQVQALQAELRLKAEQVAAESRFVEVEFARRDTALRGQQVQWAQLRQRDEERQAQATQRQTDLMAQRDGAVAQRDAAVAERDRLQVQVVASSAAREQAAVGAAQSQATLAAERAETALLRSRAAELANERDQWRAQALASTAAVEESRRATDIVRVELSQQTCLARELVAERDALQARASALAADSADAALLRSRAAELASERDDWRSQALASAAALDESRLAADAWRAQLSQQGQRVAELDADGERVREAFDRERREVTRHSTLAAQAERERNEAQQQLIQATQLARQVAERNEQRTGELSQHLAKAQQDARRSAQTATDREQLLGHRDAQIAKAEAQVRQLRDDLTAEQGRYARALERVAAGERRSAGSARKLGDAIQVLRSAAESQSAAPVQRGEWHTTAAMARHIINHDRRSGAGATRLLRVSFARWRKHGTDGALERLKKEYQKLAVEHALPPLESARDRHDRLSEQFTLGLAMALDGRERLVAALPDGSAAGARAAANSVGPAASSGAKRAPAALALPTPPAAPVLPAPNANVPLRRMPADKNKLRATALVLTWDVGHNPLGRSYMLGEVLQRVVRNVVMVGFQFPRYGKDVWEPVREGALPVIGLPGEDLPQFLDSLERIAERMRPDIVIACKPRLPSLQLGALIKQRFGCPLVVDIDDHELSFFDGASELTIDELAAMDAGVAAAQREPYAQTWTRLAQHMCKYADERIVSNVALQREFGGRIIAHVRDETVFDPQRFDRRAMRRKYGVQEDAKVVLFFGTPRHHKGIDALAQAVAAIDDRDFRLVVVGSTTDRSVTAKLEKIALGRIDFLPNQPFAAVPEIVSMADVICLPQDESHPISQFQLPAKAIDAVAMGIPLLVTRTPPLQQLIDDGVATAVDRADLATAIVRAAGQSADATRAAALRQRFLDRYSHAAAAKMLRTLIEGVLSRRPSPMPDLPALIAHQRRVLGVPAVAEVPRREPGIDIVVFWKQNDSGLYGRRPDMVIEYLASRSDVRRVLVLDAPTSEFDLLKRLDNAGAHTQDRLIYQTTYEKVFGKLDRAKLRFDVFVYPPGVHAPTPDSTGRTPLINAYEGFLRGVFEREGIDPQRAVFWLYPKNFMAPALVERFAPARVVVDVVDDHRAWPGVSAQERERLTDNYRQTLALADMAFTNCEPVRDAMREYCPQVRLVPNGCDAAPRREPLADDAAYEAFAKAPGKVIGFVGNLEQKIDIELIDRIAERFADCKIVLIGSTHANPKVRELDRHANVLMTGVVPYAKIGAWIARFDVGIVPHLNSEMTQSMNPLKLYVYLSHRVPVVSSEVFNIDRSSAFVKVARSHEEFLDRVAELLGAGAADAAALGELERYVEENCWKARFEQHVNELLAGVETQVVMPRRLQA